MEKCQHRRNVVGLSALILVPVLQRVVLEGRRRAAAAVLQRHADDGIHHVLEQLRNRLLASRGNPVLPEGVHQAGQVLRPEVVEQSVGSHEAEVSRLHVQRIGRPVRRLRVRALRDGNIISASAQLEWEVEGVALLRRVVADEPLLGRRGGGGSVLHRGNAVVQHVQTTVANVVEEHLVVHSHRHRAERAAAHSL